MSRFSNFQISFLNFILFSSSFVNWYAFRAYDEAWWNYLFFPIYADFLHCQFRPCSRSQLRFTAIVPTPCSCRLSAWMRWSLPFLQISDRLLRSCIIVPNALSTSILNKWTKFFEVLLLEADQNQNNGILLHSFSVFHLSGIAVQIC